MFFSIVSGLVMGKRRDFMQASTYDDRRRLRHLTLFRRHYHLRKRLRETGFGRIVTGVTEIYD